MTEETPEKSRLSFLGSRRHEGYIEPYSRRVQQLRLLLPLAAFILIALLMTLPRFEKMMNISPAATPPEKLVGAPRNELLKARFEGRDDDGNPFILTAVRAVQNVRDLETVDLEQPRAESTRKDGVSVSGAADTGTYRQKDNILMLSGHVTVSSTDGYEAWTDRLLVNLMAQKVSADTPITGKGPAGTLEATGLQYTGEENRIVLTGPVRLVLTEPLQGISTP